MARKAAGGTPATTALDRAAVQYKLHHYAHDPRSTSFGLEAAEQLGVPAKRVFKTLVVSSAEGLAVALVPVSGRLDLKAMAAALGVKKVELAPAQAAERSSGMVVGGISPIGQRRSLPTVIDASAQDQRTIFVSAGARGVDVELSPGTLIDLLGAKVAQLAQP